MRMFCIYKNIKGFVRLSNYTIKFNTMVQPEALKKVKIITFFEKHGLEATLDAFKVSKSSIYNWRKTLKQNNGKIEALNNQSRRPKGIKRRIISKEIQDFIINIRGNYGRIGKVKISRILKENKIADKSESTVGRIIEDLKKKGILKEKNNKVSFYGKTGNIKERQRKKRKKERRKDYKPQKPGDLLQIDTITKFIGGVKRYVITAIDLKSDFAFAYGYKRLNSSNAVDFFKKLEEVCPFKIKRIQTDNGLEFEKYFREYIKKRNIIHYHNYPRCPKMNAFIERFNRTIQDEFINRKLDIMFYDIALFNQRLIDYLIWYNTKRPHWSLNLISPVKYLITNCHFSNMYWTST